MRQSSASRDGAGFGGRRVLAGGGTALAVIFAFRGGQRHLVSAARAQIADPVVRGQSNCPSLPLRPPRPGGRSGIGKSLRLTKRTRSRQRVIRLEAEEPASAAGDPAGGRRPEGHCGTRSVRKARSMASPGR